MHAIDRHAVLIDHGWHVAIDGRWLPPDPNDRERYTIEQAWLDLRSQLARGVRE
jgi:hypothetical protein